MNLLGMFAKYWQPGRVKTRLAAGIGPEQAAEIYRLFVETLLERFASVADQRQLVYAPPDRQAEMEQLAGIDWQALPQSAGDLGQRMHSFFEAAFAAGADRVVLIGSDSPLLPHDHLLQAFDMLATCELVLGPSSDGGYYLVGAARQTPPIFNEVEWSTPAVLEQTLTRATAAGVTHKLLPTWYDVDDRQDLAQLSTRLAESSQWPTLRTAVQAALSNKP